MTHPVRLAPLAVAAALAAGLPGSPAADEPKAAFPAFEMKEIDRGLGVGYAVLPVDVDGDGKLDFVVVDQRRVVWYQGPDWKKRTLIEGVTKPDNVSIAAHDVDGDGKVDFALAADWRPFDTAKGGTLQWLRRGKTLDEPWQVFPIAEEPTLHRIRFADLKGDGKPVLVAGPLMGRDASKGKNWLDGKPLRLLAYSVPKDPVKDRWPEEVIDASLHVLHNFVDVPPATRKTGRDLLTASYEGVHLLTNDGKAWAKQLVHEGNQATPDGSRGASEVKRGKLKDGTALIATIEPWHGHEVVVYTPSEKKGPWRRTVLDDKLKWGHAVWFADLDGDGDDELIIGVRDNLSDRPGERCGVRIYKAVDAAKGKWERHVLDDGGIAVEDLAAADLFGSGKIDIVAVGRATHNVRVYRNLGKR